MRIVILAGLLAVGSFIVVPAMALDSIWIVRHAEKESGWPSDVSINPLQPLSTEGVQRSQRLAERLSDQPIVVVVASPTTRTLHTGLPTAQDHGVALRADAATLDPERIGAWLLALREEFAGPGAALIVGHGNTVPWFLDALGADQACYAQLGISEQPYGPGVQGYSDLWHVRLEARTCDAIVRYLVP